VVTAAPITAQPAAQDAAVLDAIAWTLAVSPDWSADELTVIADLIGTVRPRIPANWTLTPPTGSVSSPPTACNSPTAPGGRAAPFSARPRCDQWPVRTPRATSRRLTP